MPTHNPRARRLRLVLAANAAFSTLGALPCLLLAGPTAELLGLPRAEVLGLGLQLLVFAIALTGLAALADLGRRWARLAVLAVIALDLLFVAGSVAAVLGAVPLTVAGRWIVAGTALVVADFAVLQLLAWRALGRREGSPAEPSLA